MIKFIKKHKLKFISYFLCSFAMALFAILSFSCKTYAYTIDNNGNLVGDNLFNIDNLNESNLVTKSQINNYNITSQNMLIITTNDANDPYLYFKNTIELDTGTYTFSFKSTTNIQHIGLTTNNTTSQIFDIYNTNNGNYTITVNDTTTYGIGIELYQGTTTLQIMLNNGNEALEWEPYGVWYSETNYEIQKNLYDNTLSQYNDLALSNNYGYWKYIQYVEFEESNNIIFVPNTQEQNEWSITDLTTYNILKVGGYFDTTPLTMVPYQSNYNEVDTHINFKGYTPSDSFIISFNHSNGAQVVIYDENNNSFNYTISDVNSLIDIDINIIRQSVPNFGLYIIDMYIRPNNAEQNGIYFANNDYITAYNKGYNVATSNSDRKYIPQITDLQNQINSLNNNVVELTNNINTLKALNTDLQNQITNSTSWQNLFFAFADTPFKVVSNVLGFELFGLNLFSTFIGMITVFGVVYLLKKFL